MPENNQPDLSVNADLSAKEKATLLLVDDDPLIIEGLGFMLRKHYKLITAESRHQAIQKINEEQGLPSLAFLIKSPLSTCT